MEDIDGYVFQLVKKLLENKKKKKLREIGG